jgi:radical SAM superfamily enzyme YgiQ (UPF0313 family)
VRILLVQHALENTDAYPLGLGYVAAALIKAGHDIDFIDLALQRRDPFNTLLSKVKGYRPNALGFSTVTSQYNECSRLVKRAERYLPEIPIIMGGHHASALPEEVLRDGAASVVVVSEGEKTAPELFSALENNADLKSIAGIVFVDDQDSIVQTLPRKQVRNLDEIPYPPWNILRPERYHGRMRGRKKSNVLTSRGCPYHCVHCHRGPTGGLSVRQRSVDNILGEIIQLHENYEIGAIGFRDDIFTFKRYHTLELCDAIIAERLDIIWDCEARVDMVDYDLLNRMKQAGCVRVDFGVESGSEKILYKIGKKITKDDARKAFQYCRQLGLPTRAFFIIGTPWETRETVNETISFAKEIRPTVCHFFLATPYPGTRLQEEFIKAGWPIPSNYDEYRHWTEGIGFMTEKGENPCYSPQRHFISECLRATREITKSQILNFRGYPQLLRAFLCRYSPSEMGRHLLERLWRMR